MRNKTYKTKQKNIILEIIKKEEKPFTIKEIYEKIKGVGLTTVYRLVDKLVEEGIIDKYIGKEGKNYYQYLEKCEKSNHFYLKCEVCGSLTHVDCDCIEKLSLHITKNHKFKPSKNKIIIDGKCYKCKEKTIWKNY